MSDDAVQMEILEAEKVIRRLASKLQDAADTAETLALSQQAYLEAGEALRNVAALLAKTHDVITDQSKRLSTDAESLVSRSQEVIGSHSKMLSAATASLVSGTHHLIADQGKKLSDAVATLVSKGKEVIVDQSRKLSTAADSLVSRTNDAMQERGKALKDTADSLQNTNKLLSNTREAIAKEGESWGAAAASITEGIDTLKLSASESLQSLKLTIVEALKSKATAQEMETLKVSTIKGLQFLNASLAEDLKSIATSIGSGPHSIVSKLDLLETQNSKDLKELSASLRACIENRMHAMKQAILSSDVVTVAGFESAALSVKQLDKVVCNRAHETHGLLREIAKNGSYFLWAIAGVNGLIAIGVAVILIKLFSH